MHSGVGKQAPKLTAEHRAGRGASKTKKKNLCQKAAAKTIVRAFILRQISY
jgi:hypothetical protein